MLPSLLFVVGLAAVVAGVALVFPPAAFVVAGVTLCAVTILLHRGQTALDAEEIDAE